MRRKLRKITSLVCLFAILFGMGDTDITHAAEISNSVGLESAADTDMDHLPYISSYFVEPTVKTGQEVKLKFYVTDYSQKEYRENDISETFTLTIKVDGKKDIVTKVKAGNTTVSIGSFLEEKEINYSAFAVDSLGRSSQELFGYFRVYNGKTENIYSMTSADLTAYNINGNDNRAIRQYVDVEAELTDANKTVINEAIDDAYNTVVVPSGKYIVLIPRNINNPDKVECYFKYTKVKYADDYDAEAVALESVATKAGLQKLLDDKKSEGYTGVKLLNGVYRINEVNPLLVPNEFTLDLNESTIKLNQFTGDSGSMCILNNVNDSHLINGTFEGDYYEHDYANSSNSSEWVCGIGITGASTYCTIENVDAVDITGYGIINGLSSNNKVAGPTATSVRSFSDWTRVDIDDKNGQENENSRHLTSGYGDIEKSISSKGYVSFSKYLGYQGIIGNTMDIIVHLYDADKNYIKSIRTYQYREIKVPDNTKYARVTLIDAENLASGDGICAMSFYKAVNCIYANMNIDNARAVGITINQMRNNLFDNISVTRSGQSLAHCALDAEDGWDGMQDVTFRNMYFDNNYINDFLTCAGHNFIIENMKKGKIYCWERTNGVVIEGEESNIESITLRYSNKNKNGYRRVQNVTTSGINFQNADKTDWTGVAKNGNIVGKNSQAVNCTYTIDEETGKYTYLSAYLYNCRINNNGYNMGAASYEDCTITNSGKENQGGFFVNCKLSDISGNLHHTTELYNCELSNMDVYTGSYNPHIFVENSKLTDVKIKNGYWCTGNRISIKNSSITIKDSFLRTPTYSTLYPVEFINNTIDYSGEKGFIEYYDDRDSSGSQGKERSYVRFEKNIFTNVKENYLLGLSMTTQNTNNMVNVYAKGNDFGNLKIFTTGKENYAQFNFVEEPNDLLEASIEVNKQDIKIGEEITFTANAKGGSGKYKYGFLVYNETTDSWYRFTKESSQSELKWTASSYGKRKFYVDVTDSDGNTVRSKELVINLEEAANEKLQINASASSKIAIAGDVVKFSATAKGGSGKYTYKFIIHNTDNNQWFLLRDYASSNELSWTAGSEGNREIFIDVKDSAGNVVRCQALNVKVGDDKNVVAELTGSKASAVKGDTIRFSATAKGGSGKYTYKFIVHNTDNNQWFMLSDFGTINQINWTAGSTGNREFFVDVKDTVSGRITRGGVAVEVS